MKTLLKLAVLAAFLAYGFAIHAQQAYTVTPNPFYPSQVIVAPINPYANYGSPVQQVENYERQAHVLQAQRDTYKLVLQRAQAAYGDSNRPRYLTLSYLLGLSDNYYAPWDRDTQDYVFALTRQVATQCLTSPTALAEAWMQVEQNLSNSNQSKYLSGALVSNCNANPRNETGFDSQRLAKLQQDIKDAAALGFYSPVARTQARGQEIYADNNPRQKPAGYDRIRNTEYVLKDANTKIAFAQRKDLGRIGANMINEQLTRMAMACRDDRDAARKDGGEVTPGCITSSTAGNWR